MEPVVRSAREMGVMEANAVALGVSIDQLMENAGRAVAEEATRHLPPPPSRVAVLAGAGNNGGDGTAAAFYLGQWGYQPEVWLVLPPTEIRTSPARRCFERIASRHPTHVGVPSSETLKPFPLLIDAMLGTGQGGPLRAPYRDAVEAARGSAVPSLSIDLPTGIGDPSGLRPRWTVALTCLKEGMTPESSGEITVREIGIPPEAYSFTGPGEFLLFHPPDRERGRSARVAVIGGGPFTGAPALAALAALRSGAERAIVIAPSPAAERIQALSPDLVVRAVGREIFRSGDTEAVLSIVRDQHVNACAIGMGAGRDAETFAFYHRLLPSLLGIGPTVVDADALGVVDAVPAALAGRAVATPNRVELRHVFGLVPGGTIEDELRQVAAVAASHHVTLVAKGEPDLLSDGERSAANRTHHPAGSVGGSGDVLAGVLASLLAAGASGWEAARLATYWVGAASLRAYDTLSYGVIASDVLGSLPATLGEGLRRAEGFRGTAGGLTRSGPGP